MEGRDDGIRSSCEPHASARRAGLDTCSGERHAARSISRITSGVSNDRLAIYQKTRSSTFVEDASRGTHGDLPTGKMGGPRPYNNGVPMTCIVRMILWGGMTREAL